MLYIKFLTGPLAGKTLPLKPGKNVVGRAPHCDVVIPSNNISKEHTLIEVYNNKIIITDLNSRNGTFINGIQIKSQRFLPGEKLGFFDILVELRVKRSIPNQRPQQQSPQNVHPFPQRPAPGPTHHGAVAYNHEIMQDQEHQDSIGPVSQQQMPDANLKSYLIRYFEDIVLPGVYKLLEWFEFKWVLGFFVALFIVFVTALSTIPLMRILKSSIEKEAQNRAQTIARSLVRENTSALSQGQTSLVKTDVADREPGVVKAYVISNYDGSILAPIQWAGQQLTDVPFVHEARKSNNEEVQQVDDSTIVAVSPIKFYRSETGSNTVAAHAAVVYNMGSLAVDGGRTLSLFIQILFIAVVLGGILYFFLFKLILRPYIILNAQVDEALRTGHSQIHIPFKFPELSNLASNINSAVSRTGGGFAGDQLQNFELDRSLEMQNLINIVGFAAISINSDRVVSAVNPHFQSQMSNTGVTPGTPISNILDQSLKLNLQNLMDSITANPGQLAIDQLELSNNNYEISAQAVMGSKSISYVVVVFVPNVGAT